MNEKKVGVQFNRSPHGTEKKRSHKHTHTQCYTAQQKTTWSIDICIHKSRSICQRNDVIQNECCNHKTSNEILTKLQRYNVEHERFSLLFTKPFMKLAQWIPLIFVHISFQFDSIEWSAFTQHRRFSFSATIHEFILQQKKNLFLGVPPRFDNGMTDEQQIWHFVSFIICFMWGCVDDSLFCRLFK